MLYSRRRGWTRSSPVALRSLVVEDDGDSEVFLGTTGQIMGSGGDKGKEGPCFSRVIQGLGREWKLFWVLFWGEEGMGKALWAGGHAQAGTSGEKGTDESAEEKEQVGGPKWG